MHFLNTHIGFILLIVIIIVIILWFVSTYNRLISTRELVRNAMGQISAQMESRWDAVRNMIEGTKQYAEYEAKTLESLTEQRASLGKNAAVAEVNKDDRLFNQAIGQLFAVAENYPDLKASQVYQDTLKSVDRYEDQLRQSRMIYNDTVTRYNRIIQSVPSNIIASLFNFTQENYFEHTETKTDMPNWS